MLDREFKSHPLRFLLCKKRKSLARQNCKTILARRTLRKSLLPFAQTNYGEILFFKAGRRKLKKMLFYV